MNANSASSASKSASSALSSGSSQASSAASSAASRASASLASGSAQASSYASGIGKDAPAKSTSIFVLSPVTISALAVAIGAAYYYGYLDGLIAYIQQMLNQAQDKKEQVMKENTGQTSVRTAARDQYDTATVKSEQMVNDLHAEAQNRTGAGPPGSPSMLSSGTH